MSGGHTETHPAFRVRIRKIFLVPERILGAAGYRSSGHLGHGVGVAVGGTGVLVGTGVTVAGLPTVW